MSFFKKKDTGFSQDKFKTQMKLSILRLTQQKSKTMNENEAKKREVAELLREGQEHKAEIKAISIIMNDYRVEVYTQLIIYLNLLAARYELLLAQHSCPAELKEACCAIVYASPHLSGQTELAACRAMLLARFGKQFPNQCMDEQVVHPKITSRLSARSPDQTIVNYYVTSIAREYNVSTILSSDPDNGDDDDNNNGENNNNSEIKLNQSDVIDDVIFPCTPSHVLAPIDPSRGTAFGPGLQDGVAGVPSSFTIDLSHCGGDVSGERVAVLVSGPEETHIMGDVAPNGDGTYAATYLPPLPGNYAVAVYCGNKHIGSGQPWLLNVRPAASAAGSGFSSSSSPADPRMCQASGSGLTGGVAGVTSSFSILARTSDGQVCGSGGEVFNVFVSGPNDARIRGDVVDNNNGTYSATYVPPYPGQYALAVYCGKTPIGDGAPWVFDVRDAPAALDPARCHAEGPGLEDPAAENQALFSITAVATDGSLRADGGDRFDVLISGPNDARIRGDVVDNHDGTYIAVYTPPFEGTYAVAIYANGAAIIGDGRPIVVNVRPQAGALQNGNTNPPFAGKCVAEGDGLYSGTVDSLVCFNIHAFDANGDPCGCGGADFSVFVSGPGVQIAAEVLDNNDGTYLATYTPPAEGTYDIAVMLGTEPIGDGRTYSAVITGGAKKDVMDEEEDDLMARFAMLKASEAESSAGALPPAGAEVPMNDDDDDLMAKFNALKAGETPENTEAPAGLDEEDDLMAKFNALKAGETPENTETPMNPDEEDDLMAKFNALKAGETPTSAGAPMDLDEEDDLMAKFNSIKSSGSSLMFPPSMVSQDEHVFPEPQVHHIGSLPDVPLSNLFAVRKAKACFANCNVDKCVVLDNGSGTIKCGIAGMTQPLAHLPTVIGRPLYRSVLPMMNTATVYVGDEAKRKKGVLSLEYPIEHGVVRDWDAMESVWHHTFFNELRIDPSARPVVLAEHTLAPRQTREKSAEIMFEKFGVPGFFAASQAALALHAVGATTGVVVDVGDGAIQTAAVVNGEVLTHAACRAEFGGRDCTDLFINLLSKEGVFLGDTSSERDIARDIKEKLGYVALDYDSELKKARNDVVAQYSMPDGDVALVYHSRFSCAEPLFRPKMVGKDTMSLPQMVAASILRAPPESQAELARNVVLVGGSSLFRGMPERLVEELRQILPAGNAVDKLVLPENRECAAWVGGSMLGNNVESYECVCITREEYNESGVSALAFMK